MFGGGSSGPVAPPPLPDPLPTPPSYASGGNKPAGNQTKVPGFGATLMTGPSGVDSSGTNVQRKSLLGQ